MTIRIILTAGALRMQRRHFRLVMKQPKGTQRLAMVGQQARGKYRGPDCTCLGNTERSSTQCAGDTFDIAQEYNPLAGDDWDDFEEDTERWPADTQEEIARQFNRAILGYQHQLKDSSQTAVMILDSATPGRLSVRYYQELQGSKLLANIKDWHDTFQWQLEYRSVEEPTELGKSPRSRKLSLLVRLPRRTLQKQPMAKKWMQS